MHDLAVNATSCACAVPQRERSPERCANSLHKGSDDMHGRASLQLHEARPKLLSQENMLSQEDMGQFASPRIRGHGGPPYIPLDGITEYV